MQRQHPKTYQHIITSSDVIHTSIEYTAREAFAQGKNLQNNRSFNFLGPRRGRAVDAGPQTVRLVVVFMVKNAYYT
jgi:hypothetical protein